MNSPDPARPRPAATLLLVRDAAAGAGIEVFMMERAVTVDFPGLHVFPGGKVDAQDFELARRGERLGGAPDDAFASRHMALPEGGLAYWITALRECFEEAGVLLAHDAAGRDPTAWDDVVHRELDARRAAVARGELALAALLDDFDLTLALDALAYFSHWITPPTRARRYDTRFFIAKAPAVGHYRHDDSELVGSHWVGAAAALGHADSGAWQLIMPTRSTLEVLADHHSVASLLATVERGTHLPALTPFLSDEGMQAMALPAPDA